MSTAVAPRTTARQNTEWWNAGLDAIQTLAKTGKPFEAYDVAKIIGEPYHPNHWGNLFGAAKTHGIIVKHGAFPSARPERSGGTCWHWVGARPAEPVRLRAVNRQGATTPYELVRADQLRAGDVVARKASPNGRIEIVAVAPSTERGKTHIDYVSSQGAKTSEAFSGEKFILHERAEA